MTKGSITNGKWKGENGECRDASHASVFVRLRPFAFVCVLRPFSSVCVRMRVAPVISPAVLCPRALVSRANIGPNNH